MTVNCFLIYLIIVRFELLDVPRFVNIWIILNRSTSLLVVFYLIAVVTILWITFPPLRKLTHAKIFIHFLAIWTFRKTLIRINWRAWIPIPILEGIVFRISTVKNIHLPLIAIHLKIIWVALMPFIWVPILIVVVDLVVVYLLCIEECKFCC